jgi:Glyoxalase-like domain
MNAQLDHLVVAARTLGEGVQWCEATLGITPGLGGEHKLFGTHNRLFRIGSAEFARAYFEIIAINPQATQEGRSPGKRWFDMDDAAVQAAISQTPRLLHFVASTSNVKHAVAALQKQGIERGPAVQASRMTANGLLEWQITVRPDGQRLFNGALPTLIEWGSAHPAHSMPDSGVSLHSVRITHPDAEKLQAAYAAIGLQGVEVTPGAPNIFAALRTPRGVVTLESQGV